MTTQILCAYTAIASGALTPTQLAVLMAAVPLDNDFLIDYGLLVTADSTLVAGTTVGRGITLGMNPTVLATAVALLAPGNVASSVVDIDMTATGSDYVAVPAVTIGPPIAGSRQALAHANLGVVSVSVSAGGASYSAQSFVLFSGGQVPPGSADATTTLTIVGGVVTGVTVVTQGGPYGRVPKATVVDPTGAGSGAVLAAHLGVVGIDVDDPGSGYTSAPTVSVTSLFKAMFPDSSNQAAPVAAWMQEVFQQALLTPVIAAAPLVS